jgi:hypothetical protein
MIHALDNTKNIVVRKGNFLPNVNFPVEVFRIKNLGVGRLSVFYY